MKVEEFPWCVRVVGTVSVPEARQFYRKRVSGSKRKVVDRMPARPAWFADVGKAVVLYFAVAPGAERNYKT